MVKPPIIAFLLAVIAVMGGIYLADQAGWIHLRPPPEPRADQLWEVTFLASSDTDRTESGETISTDGHTITYIMNDANMDGLGDVNLDIRVTNMNVGGKDEIWPMKAELTFVSTTAPSSAAQPIVNMTDLNSRYAITWTLTDAGSPTLAQVGNYAISSDWTTGMSDQLNADLEMNPTATDDLAVGTPGKLQFMVGGIQLQVDLLESV